jgi:hypothetical protein
MRGNPVPVKSRGSKMERLEKNFREGEQRTL